MVPLLIQLHEADISWAKELFPFRFVNLGIWFICYVFSHGKVLLLTAFLVSMEGCLGFSLYHCCGASRLAYTEEMPTGIDPTPMKLFSIEGCRLYRFRSLLWKLHFLMWVCFGPVYVNGNRHFRKEGYGDHIKDLVFNITFFSLASCDYWLSAWPSQKHGRLCEQAPACSTLFSELRGMKKVVNK